LDGATTRAVFQDTGPEPCANIVLGMRHRQRSRGTAIEVGCHG